jgi:hypothetical protein
MGAARSSSPSRRADSARVALVCWIALIFIRREHVDVPRFFWPLAAFGGATLVSAAFSIDPLASLVDSGSSCCS